MLIFPQLSFSSMKKNTGKFKDNKIINDVFLIGTSGSRLEPKLEEHNYYYYVNETNNFYIKFQKMTFLSYVGGDIFFNFLMI